MTEEARRPDVRQEKDLIPRGRILLVAFAALTLSAMLTIASWIILDSSRRALRPSGRFPEARIALELEVSAVQRELLDGEGPGQRLNAEKRRELSSYRWVDRGRGLVSIPIDEAMLLLVEEQAR